ncbi:MAG: DUF1152 domain-containing protein, partial [Crenarchaeota archaeon]|nr:DUF1152 domain-containing protein [Thermoproteota archaeon]
LPLWEGLDRVNRVASSGGYRWARAVPRWEAGLLRESLGLVYTEAGLAALRAVEGRLGVYTLRGGSRRIEVTVLHALTFFLDAAVAAGLSLARLVAGSWSLEEARRRLNEAGVYTELDLEEDIALFASTRGRLPGPGELAAIREAGRRRLRGASA